MVSVRKVPCRLGHCDVSVGPCVDDAWVMVPCVHAVGVVVVIILVVDVACAHVEAPEVVVVVDGKEVVRRTPAVCVFEAVAEEEEIQIHVMAAEAVAAAVVVDLHTMDNSAVHEKSEAQVGEGRDGASSMPTTE